jgi:hypothetical protein
MTVAIAHALVNHNAWRPLWLCDIAAALESRPSDFDWDLCLSGQRHRVGWFACTVGLAHHLLEADIEATPVSRPAQHLPNWLVPAVLRQWDRCMGPGHRGRVVHYIASHWRDPLRIFREVRERWDMPIAATVALGGPFNDFPRLPFRLVLALSHVPIWCQELGRYLKTRRVSLTAPWSLEPNASRSVARSGAGSPRTCSPLPAVDRT